MAGKVNPIPEGYGTVTPYLSVRNASAALEYYKKAFGAEELFRMDGPDGKIGHAEFTIGGSRIMIADEVPEMPELACVSPETLGGSAVSFMIYVPDVDAAFKKALAAGGTVQRPVENQFYGDRSGIVKDPFGHYWTLATHVEDVEPEEMARRAAELMKG